MPGGDHPTRGRRLPPEPLTLEEATALLDACSSTWAGIRDRALLTLLWRSGLRVSEAMALRPNDLDRKLGMIRVLHGKGDKARTVSMDERAFAALEPWEEVRVGLGAKLRDPLFCTRTLRKINPSYLRQLLPKLAKRAEITKRVHAHGFRHTCAAEMAAEGIPMNVIQAQLGHADLGTTSTYLNHIAPTQLVNAMQGRPAWKEDESPPNTTQSTASKKRTRKKKPPRKV